MRSIRLVLQWQRFGPYHIARLGAVFRKLAPAVEVVGLEIANQDSYLWRPVTIPTHFERYRVIDQETGGEIPKTQIWRKTWAALEELKPDVMAVAGYQTAAGLAILTWCKLHRRPIILMSETKQDDFPRQPYREFIKKLTVRQYAAALVGGTPQKSYMEQLGMSQSKIHLGYDAVDNQYFAKAAQLARLQPPGTHPLPGLDDTTPFFLASARFIPRKNLDNLLYAYSRYRSLCQSNQAMPWRLVILGDGPEKNSLIALKQELGLSEVCFAGVHQIEEIPVYYGLASVFVHPAVQDQWGLVVNEAMACGLPVLVSNKAGCAQDLVVEGKTGFTFDPCHPEELAQLMLKMNGPHVDLAEMGRAAEQHIAHWGVERFADGMGDALETSGFLWQSRGAEAQSI